MANNPQSHSDGLFPDIWGTMKGMFHVSGPTGACLSTDPNRYDLMITYQNDENEYASHYARNVTESPSLLQSDINHLVALLDLQGRCPNIEGGFHGDIFPSTPVTGGFYICHTDGTNANKDEVWYYSGTNWIQIPFTVVRTCTTKAAVSGDLTMNANSVYAYELVGSDWTWVLKGTVSVGGLKVARLDASGQTNSVSTCSISVGEVVLSVKLIISQAYSSGIISVKTNGTNGRYLMNTFDNRAMYANTYVKEHPEVIGTNENGNFVLDVSQTTGSGSCTCYIVFGEPLV